MRIAHKRLVVAHGKWLRVVVPAALAVGCTSNTMQVTFQPLPAAVDSAKPGSCHILSRSPIEHLMRVTLQAMHEGQPVPADEELVKITVLDVSGVETLGVTDVKPDGMPHEFELHGKVEAGDELEVKGSFNVGGEREEFSQQCLVD